MSPVTRIEQIEPWLVERLRRAFAAAGAPDAAVTLARPPRAEMGDYAVPCFPLAKALRQPPPKIAATLAAALEPDEILAGAAAEGGFLNLRLDPGALARITIAQVLADSAGGARVDGFGGGSAAPRRKVLVEFSSPNTNKPLHLGHVRNNAIGLAVCRMLAHAGHDVTSVSLVNDRGVHICKTMTAYRRWHAGESPADHGRKGDHYVGDLYVELDRRLRAEYEAWLASEEGEARFHEWDAERQAAAAARAAREAARGKAAKPTPSEPDDARALFAKAFADTYFNTASGLGAETRDLLRRWEAGDPAVRELWSRMNGWVFDGFAATYARMGVRFDLVDYESRTYLLGRSVVEDGLARGLFHRLDDGAVVCDYAALGIASQSPHKVLLRADGTTVYTTQDLGTALSRHDALGFEQMVYVVGDEQKHHFRVLFALLGLVRPALADACQHLAYGMVNLPEGRMKSREGTVVDADDLFDEMAALAAAELRARSEAGRAHAVAGEDDTEIARRAEVIAQGAVKFHLLSFNAASTMTFDPQQSIDFLGKTGPYCQNAYARTRQVLAKAGDDGSAVDPAALARLTSDREQAVVRALAAVPVELARAVELLDPSKVVDATFEVARAFNQLYTDKDGHPIVGCADPETRAARLALTRAVGVAVRTGLFLLGIEALDKM
jgi:arginyl-tRNA synthetase